MFCNNCGNSLPEHASFCTNCGTTQDQALPTTVPSKETPVGPNLGQLIGDEVKARSKDAWQGIKLFAKSPVGGLHTSFQLFDPSRALAVAGVFTILYLAMVFIGLYNFSSKTSEIIPFIGRIGSDLSFKQVMQLVIIALTPVATLSFSANIARQIFRGKGSFIGDFYIASAALLPYGLLCLVASILGLANLEIIGALAVFALTYMVLMLYAGCSRISGIPESGAAPAVPTMLLLTGWLTKVVVSTLFS